MHSVTFFGSDQYSAIVLATLLSTKYYQLSTIITDRPKPKGKAQIIRPNPVEKLAINHNIKVLYYPTNSIEMGKFISTLKSIIHNLPSTSPIGLCASFDHLLLPKIISPFKGNLFNLHPSLLPQYRNVSPVQYALALGDQVTGITLFKITAGIDNGEIVAQISEPIRPDDTTPTLTSRLFSLGSQLFLDYLASSVTLPYHSEAQPSEGWIFTRRLTRHSGFLEWPVLQKLLANEPISLSETINDLLRLRLQKILSSGLKFGAWSLVLSDLIRSLTPWPSVWSIADTTKGPLRITLAHSKITNSKYKLQILISGKPKPIGWDQFTKYYL